MSQLQTREVSIENLLIRRTLLGARPGRVRDKYATPTERVLKADFSRLELARELAAPFHNRFIMLRYGMTNTVRCHTSWRWTAFRAAQ